MTDGINQFTGKPRVWDKYFDAGSLNDVAKESFEKQFDAYENTPEGKNAIPKAQASIDLVNSYGHKIDRVKVASTFMPNSTGIDIGYNEGNVRFNYQFNPTDQTDFTLNKKGNFIESKFGGNDGSHHEMQHINDLDYVKIIMDKIELEKKAEPLIKVAKMLNANEPIENPNSAESKILEIVNKLPDLQSKNKFLEDAYKPIAEEIAKLEVKKEEIRYKSEQKAVAAENIFLDEDHQRAGGAYILRMNKDDKKHMDSNLDDKLDLKEIAAAKAAINFGLENEKSLDPGFFKDALKALESIEMEYKGHHEKGKNVNPGHENNPDTNKGKFR